jgi:2-polyprenyl-3-methyl-5-hydroxy-6-metoxy-1,4-benzoquinol methylase
MRAYLGRLDLVRRFLAARLRRGLARSAPGGPRSPLNGMFSREAVALLEAEKARLETFDLGLFSALNDPRLIGQITFEYGTLVSAVPSWRGLRVLDIGTGRSTLPCWMAAQGASVVTFEHPEPVEVPGGGALARLNGAWLRRHRRRLGQVAGNMLELPFADEVFDIVTCLSVIEHLDTELPSRVYLPYPEQRRRAARVLDEMARVARAGALLYLTSECCDYTRATADAWRDSYYYRKGPPLSGAWPVRDVPEIFYDHLAKAGCTFPGGVSFEPDALDGSGRHQTFRGPYFSAFSVLARVERQP